MLHPQDLRRLYVLFQRVGALEELKAGFSGYVKRVGHELVADDKRDKELIAALLDLRKRVSLLCGESITTESASPVRVPVP